ncbi:MAG TPA: hypothetical protein VMT35_12545, partial [Ignavibacteriaceae bacterium]|nr:hypothetical protein [Ignavibacteriaceae bacterium]
MKKGIFSFVFIIIAGQTVFTQVTIKERVEIEPKEYPIVSSAAAINTITFNLHWDNLTVGGLVYTQIIPCRNVISVSERDGDICLRIDTAQAGAYRFRVEGTRIENQRVNFTYQVLLNGAVVKSGSASVLTEFNPGSLSWAGFDVDYTPSLISNYYFKFPQYNKNLCYQWGTIAEISTYNSCERGISWNVSTEPINLSIVEGGEYTSFYYCTGENTYEPRGDNLTVLKSDYDSHIRFRQDVIFNGEESRVVKVQAEWGGLIRMDTVRIYPRNRYCIKAKVYDGDDTLYNGEELQMKEYGYTNVECNYCTPLSERFSAEIIKGGEYGDLYNYNTGEIGKSLDSMEQYTEGPGQSCGDSYFSYIADGVTPERVDSIIIRLSCTDAQIPSADKVLIIKPPPIKVTIEPDRIAPGDTAKIIIQKRNLDGTIEDCPPEEIFEIGLVEGCALGNISFCRLWEGSEYCEQGSYFWGVDQSAPIYFVADSSADSGDIIIQAGYIDNWENLLSYGKTPVSDSTGVIKRSRTDIMREMKEQAKSMSAVKETGMSKNMLAPEDSSSCSLNEMEEQKNVKGKGKVEKTEDEILLGETKYYQARYLNGKLHIDTLSGPYLWNGGLTEDVWGVNPVTIVKGDKLGVYWETEKPVWNGNEFVKDLDKGLIRLVGRYWKEDVTYIVRLKAKKDNQADSID